MDKKEITYLKKVFASFGCKDADIVQVETGEDLLSSFAVNVDGISIESSDCVSLLSVGDYPHFAIVQKKGDYMQIDFCMDLEHVIDYVVKLYLTDDFDELGVYLISDEDETPYCVEFGAGICCGDDAITVENFGTVKSKKICDRAVLFNKSNLPFRDYFEADIDNEDIEVDGFFLSNVMDLRMVNEEHETYADNCRFATTIDQLNGFMNWLREDDYSFNVIVHTNLLCVESASEVEGEFEFNKNYWRSVYEEGLEA